MELQFTFQHSCFANSTNSRQKRYAFSARILSKIIKETAEQTLPAIAAKGNQPPISERMKELAEERLKAIEEGYLEYLKEVKKAEVTKGGCRR